MPYLRLSLNDGTFMNGNIMSLEDRLLCHWLRYGIGKGITDPNDDISVFGVPRRIYRGLHRTLINGFNGIDPFPLCYDSINHVKGFGSFVRWVYFADPHSRKDFLGIDFSISLRSTSGVANSVVCVAKVAKIVFKHGVPSDTEIVLIGPKMCEHPGVTKMRREAGLIYITDWLNKYQELFGKGKPFCPCCGQRTFDKKADFCYLCGSKRDALFSSGKEGSNGMETR